MKEFYSNLKIFNFPDHLESYRNKRPIAPIHIRLKPMNTCNHNCWYCAYRVDHLQLGENMDKGDQIPEKKMEQLIKDIISMGVKSVTLSGGGEPLLYPKIERHIEKLAMAGIRIATLTNGSFLKGRVAEVLAKHATWIRISMDSWDPMSHHKSREAPLSDFSRIIENIKEFSRINKKAIVGINYVISKDNYHKIRDFTELVKSIGVHHLKFSPAIISNEAHVNNEYHRPTMALVIDEIKRSQQLVGPDFKIINHFHSIDENFERPYTNCHYLNFLTVIGADCKIYTCQDKAYTSAGELGNFSKSSFKKSWFSDQLQSRLKTLNPQKLCNHHCVTNSKNIALEHFLSIEKEHDQFV